MIVNKILEGCYNSTFSKINDVFPQLSLANQEIIIQLLENKTTHYELKSKIENNYLSKLDEELLSNMIKNKWFHEKDFLDMFVSAEFHSSYFKQYTFLKENFNFFSKSSLVNKLFSEKINGTYDNCYTRFLIWDDKSFSFLFSQGERLDEKDLNNRLMPYNETILSLLTKQNSAEILKVFLPYLQQIEITQKIEDNFLKKPEYKDILMPYIEKKNLEKKIVSFPQTLNKIKNKI